LDWVQAAPHRHLRPAPEVLSTARLRQEMAPALQVTAGMQVAPRRAVAPELPPPQFCSLLAQAVARERMAEVRVSQLAVAPPAQQQGHLANAQRLLVPRVPAKAPLRAQQPAAVA
jgi:hypothetical protein